MNNTQLYVSIGVPSLLVILAWLSNSADIQRMVDRVDKGHEAMRAEMNCSIGSLRGEMARSMESLRREMIAFRREINTDFTAFRKEINADMTVLRREIHFDMVPLHERMAKIEERQEKP